MSYYYYTPPPFQTTFIDKSFPQRHWPLDNTRHKPRADVRETVQGFYIDVELPGLGAKEELKLNWTNNRTLLIDATLKRPEISIEGQSPKIDVNQAATQTEDETGALKAQTVQHSVHQTIKERHMGTYSRAFFFGVEVVHETLEASLKYGLLRISVQKSPEEHKELKEIQVKHPSE
ncbi:HSP20-like chaperone [Tothia fuscella]|uniref:HSP20-like chaperone n=1 Tax=Tothia fuscella TaxID=1048955 RepID=A0A9P4NH97_9PEZI|nr:HSP20-like chaperone [Tothia fuscella]